MDNRAVDDMAGHYRQLTLFSEPQLQRVERIQPEVAVTLERIARQAADTKAYYVHGFVSAYRPLCSTLRHLLEHLSGEVKHVQHYLIVDQGALIGYAAIDEPDQVFAGGEYIDPIIRVVFITPAKSEYMPLVVQKTTEALEKAKREW
ncbi:hypothetical protein HY642_05720 [Candidatus Woesearchaeota archaeon]|nr:hypothetical protein [Candidatus Woesearchaeota archaeon]